tara:strand:+ start:354 stop:542 length:189 start_codon:yes stop_codon:yes gene_type:complete
MSIHFQIIWDMMKDNLVDTGIALVGIIALLAMFIPPDSPVGKFFGIFGEGLKFIKGIFTKGK